MYWTEVKLIHDKGVYKNGRTFVPDILSPPSPFHLVLHWCDKSTFTVTLKQRADAKTLSRQHYCAAAAVQIYFFRDSALIPFLGG